MLTAGACTPEADVGRKLVPVDRVELAVFWADRHDLSMIQQGLEQKGNLAW